MLDIRRISTTNFFSLALTIAIIAGFTLMMMLSGAGTASANADGFSRNTDTGIADASANLLAQDSLLDPTEDPADGGGGGTGGDGGDDGDDTIDPSDPIVDQCSDGIDNDGDGQVDAADCNCADGDYLSEEFGGDCSGGGDGGGDPSPVCGGVSLNNNQDISASASCSDGFSCGNTSDSESITADHQFSNPLPDNTEVSVGVDLDVNAQNYDSRSSANSEIQLLDGSGNVIDQATREISVDVGPQPGDESDSLETTVTFSDGGNAQEVVVNQNVSAVVGPGGGGSGHNPTSAEANAYAVDVSATSPSCEPDNQAPDAVDDGSNEAQICSGSGSPIDINVLNNDDDPDGDSLSIINLENPTQGSTAVIQKSGTDWVRYTPGSNTGTVTFDYAIGDGNGGSDTATVTVNVNESGCGQLSVQVEDTNGNPVQGVSFAPKYGEEKLPEKGIETGQGSYNVPISDTPQLAEMNESMIEEIPEGYAESVYEFDKDLEETASGQREPDGFWYPLQNRDYNRSRLATDITSGGNSPTAALTCEQSQDQTFVNNCANFAAKLDASGSSDPDGNLDEYDWESQGGFDAVTQHPDADVQACLSETDNVNLTVSDTDGNSDSVTEGVGSMCPVGGCSEVSVQSDFSGDDLSGSAYHERGSNDQDTTYNPWSPDPKTATLDVSSVLESGETAGDMTVEFAFSSGFEASVSCNSASDPADCGANAELLKDGSVLRSVSANGDADPSDTDTDNSDLTFNVDDSETVELETTGDATVNQNLNSSAESNIQISDIILEVCN